MDHMTQEDFDKRRMMMQNEKFAYRRQIEAFLSTLETDENEWSKGCLAVALFDVGIRMAVQYAKDSPDCPDCESSYHFNTILFSLLGAAFDDVHKRGGKADTVQLSADEQDPNTQS